MAKNNPIREQYEALTGSLAQSPRVCRWEELLEWPHGPGGKRAVIFCGANPWSQAILNKSKILATAGWKIHGWSTCVCVCVWGRGGCHRKESQLYLVTVCEYPVGPLMCGGACEVWNTELLLSQMFPLLWVSACACVHVKKKKFCVLFMMHKIKKAKCKCALTLEMSKLWACKCRVTL